MKHTQIIFEWATAGLQIGGLLLAGLLTTAAHAGVQKCTGADGKVVFSDQPCAAGQAASAVRGFAQSAATSVRDGGESVNAPGGANGGATGGAGNPSYDDMGQKSRRASVQAALTPECRALGDRASQALRNDAAPLEEVKQAIAQFENQCADQVQKASAAASNSRALPDAAGCRALRQSLDERRARLKTMTNREIQEFAKFQNEVSVGCR